MKKPKYSIAKFLYILGGGILLFVVVLPILFWIAYEILFPAPKICVSDMFDLKSTHTTPHISESLELIGHFGGSVQSVLTTNSYAYAGIGSEMAILDISDPSHPQRVGYHILPDKAQDIYVDGNYAYAAVGDWGFRIIDISNPAIPLEVGSYSTSVSIQKIVVSKGYAYLPLSACNYGSTFSPTRCSGAVQIIDVSNPSNPIRVGCHKMKGTPASIVVDGDFAYISEFVYSGVSEARLLKMDISNPRFARVIKVHNLDFGGKITINNDYLYISARYDKFRILDISNPGTYLETGLYDSRNPSGTRNEIYDAVVFDKYAYLVVEDVGVQVIDISNPVEPVLVSTYAVEDEINDISLAGNYVYIATDTNGLQIVNIENPDVLMKIGTYTSPKSVTKLEVVNNYIYVAAEDGGLRIIDVLNPKMPVEVGIYKLPEEIIRMAGEYDKAYITGVAIENNQAYLAIKNIGVQVVDISKPSIPTESGFYPLPNGIIDIAVRDNYGYISTGSNGIEMMSIMPDSLTEISSYKTPYSFVDAVAGDEYVYILGNRGLSTIDLSDPNIFTQVGFYGLNANIIRGMATDSEYIYIATSDGLKVIGLSDTGIPDKERIAELRGINLENLVLEGDYAYAAASNGLWVIDISDPLQPVVKGSYKTEKWAYGLAKEGNYVYLVVKDEGVRIIDVSNPSTPTKIGFIASLSRASNVAVAGNYAYVVGSKDGLRIVDVVNPAAPIEIGFTKDIGYAQDIVIKGNFAYVSLRKGLKIVDITNPYKPSIVKQYDIPDSPWRKITLLGDYAYLSDGSDGLWIVNISNLNVPDEIHYYENMYETTGIDIQGDYVYVAADTAGLRIVNISNPIASAQAGIYNETTINSHDVAVSGNLAYITNLSSPPIKNRRDDLLVLDVSNPSKPIKLGSYELPGATWGVAVDGEYIYIASGENGIFIFRYTTP